MKWTAEQSADIFTRHFHDEIRKLEGDTGVPVTTWRAGGRASKQWPHKENVEWWAHNGPPMVDAYAAWRDSVDLALWITPAGLPAVELDCQATIGGVPVKAFIDRVFQQRDNSLVIVDLKTGSRTPDSDLQLGFYKVLIQKLFGVEVNLGAYWMSRQGGVTPYADLSRFTENYLGSILQQFRKACEHDIFIPNVNSMCGSCGLRDACYAAGGKDAHLYDPLHPDYNKKVAS